MQFGQQAVIPDEATAKIMSLGCRILAKKSFVIKVEKLSTFREVDTERYKLSFGPKATFFLFYQHMHTGN